MDALFLAMFLNVLHLAVTNDPNMCGPGSCCSDYFLNDNKCTECFPGTHGKNCSRVCSEGRYGRRCKGVCPIECERKCNKSTGTCPVNLESSPDGTPRVMNSSTIQPDAHENITSISFEKKIEKFLKDKLWIIAGASSVLVIVSCSFIGVFLLCKVCKARQKRKETLDNTSPSNQTQIPLCSERYQSDRNMHNNSTSPILPPRAQDRRGAKISTDKSKIDKPEVEYSKPKPKKRYSLVRKLKVSQELTCPEGEDVFNSDEFDDDTNNSGSVEISGFPMKRSFKTFRSSGISKQTRKSTSANYGHIW